MYQVYQMDSLGNTAETIASIIAHCTSQDGKSKSQHASLGGFLVLTTNVVDTEAEKALKCNADNTVSVEDINEDAIYFKDEGIFLSFV